MFANQRIILVLGQYCFILPIMLISNCVKIARCSADRQSNLYRSLQSKEFADATLIGVGISVQLIVHLLLETLVSIRIPKKHMAARWSINMAYAIMNIMIWIALRSNSISGQIYLMLQCLFFSVAICGHCSSLNIICGDLWDHWTSLAVSGFTSLYFTLSFQDGYIMNMKSTTGILSFISISFGALLTFRTCFIWYKKFLHKKSFSDLDLDNKVCFARMCAMVTCFLGGFCILINYRNVKWEDYSITFITSFSYTVSVYVVLFSVSYARKWHAEASEVAVS